MAGNLLEATNGKSAVSPMVASTPNEAATAKLRYRCEPASPSIRPVPTISVSRYWPGSYCKVGILLLTGWSPCHSYLEWYIGLSEANGSWDASLRHSRSAAPGLCQSCKDRLSSVLAEDKEEGKACWTGTCWSWSMAVTVGEEAMHSLVPCEWSRVFGAVGYARAEEIA